RPPISDTLGKARARESKATARVTLKSLQVQISCISFFPFPRGSVQNRPIGVSSKPANGSGPELLEVVPDHECSKQGKSGLFPQSAKKIAFRRPQPRFLEVAHGSSHGFSGAEGSVCNLVLQLRGPHLRM